MGQTKPAKVFQMAACLDLKCKTKFNHQNNYENYFQQYPTSHKSHGTEHQTVEHASFKMVATTILDLKIRAKWDDQTDIKNEFPGPKSRYIL